MNRDLDTLQPYPFQKLAKLFGEVTPNAAMKPISLHIGEPKHETPRFIKDALVAGLDGLANYPTTIGSDALRKQALPLDLWEVLSLLSSALQATHQ